MTDTPTLADPGELGPSAAPAAAPSPAAKPPAPDAPRGTYEQRRHVQDQATAGDAPPPSADQQQPPPGEKVKIGKYEVSEAELGAMMDRQAQDDLRAATRPASAEAYEAKLPADMKLPGDMTYAFDQNDPSLIAARNLAFDRGWSQRDFSDALGIFASHIAGEQAVLAERSRAEVAKAGVSAPARVDAVSRFIRAEMGDDAAKPILATIVTHSHLQFYEKIMNKIASQGAASFSQSHRAAPENSPIPGYENMSFEQKRQAQDNLAARRR
jgi:hypothetical protein